MNELKRIPGVCYQAKFGRVVVTAQPGQSLQDWLAAVEKIAGKGTQQNG